MAAMLRCPVTKFATHTVSHFAFLFLLALATFGVNDVVFKYGDSAVVGSEISQDQSLESVLRPAKKILSNVQMLIIFWVVGRWWEIVENSSQLITAYIRDVIVFAAAIHAHDA